MGSIWVGGSRYRLLLLVGVIVGVSFSTESQGRHRPPHALRHQTLISSITATQLTISEDHGPKTFSITQFTEVFVNDHRATLADLRPGMRVSVTLDDPVRLRQIKAWDTH